MGDLLWIIGLILFFNFISWLKKVITGEIIPPQNTGDPRKAGPRRFAPDSDPENWAGREMQTQPWREADSIPSGLPPWLILEESEENLYPQQSQPKMTLPVPEEPQPYPVELTADFLEDSRLQSISGVEKVTPVKPVQTESAAVKTSTTSGQPITSSGFALDLSPGGVALGIVWSEILQPPRCRRPYRWGRQ